MQTIFATAHRDFSKRIKAIGSGRWGGKEALRSVGMKIEVSTTNDHRCWVGGDYFIKPSDWANLGPTMIIDLPDDEIDDDYRAHLVEQGAKTVED